MEEKSKTVDRSGNAGNQPEKMPYEQLERIAGNLNQQCNVLSQQLRQAQNVIAEFNEIGMLLDVLGKSEHFNPQFVERCSNKIEELISKAMDAFEKEPEASEQRQN